MTIYQTTGQGWTALARWSYMNEDELERFLLENPQFIASERADAWTVWARQIGSRSDNQLDLLGLSSDGSITIVECKLGSNREERREVVAQVLEYAAGLWEMSLDRFREIFRQQHLLNRDPFDLLSEQAPAEAADTGWELDQTVRIAAENLRTGRFRLVVAVDDVSERLRRIVDYVNSRGKGELKLIAVAVPRFGTPEAGVVTPQIYGDDAPAPTNRSAQDVNPTVSQLLAMAAPEMQLVVRAVHEFLTAEGGGRLTPRANKASISYDGRIAGALRSVTQLYTRLSESARDAIRADMYLDPRAMEALGTTTEAVQQELVEGGFETRGFSLRLRPTDAERLPSLKAILDAAILARVDA